MRPLPCRHPASLLLFLAALVVGCGGDDGTATLAPIATSDAVQDPGVGAVDVTALDVAPVDEGPMPVDGPDEDHAASSTDAPDVAADADAEARDDARGENDAVAPQDDGTPGDVDTSDGDGGDADASDDGGAADDGVAPDGSVDGDANHADDGAPVTEPCNEIDDDGDGLTDEDHPDKGAPCDGPDVDACANGVWICSDDGLRLRCGAESPSNILEICNGRDDDCDGETDEGFPDLDGDGMGDDCDLDDDGDGDPDSSDCAPRDATVGAGLQERCNHLDDNCDGRVDEGVRLLGDPCDGPDSDQCKLGVWTCSPKADTIECGPEAATDLVETCNGLDDDCDGETDEDPELLCRCGDGVCDVDFGEAPATCPRDCNECGDGICSCGELSTTCPEDCEQGCGDNFCEGTEPRRCKDDCPLCGDGICGPCEGCRVDCCGPCGDGVCAGPGCGEDAERCPGDCGRVCGDGVCEAFEMPNCRPDCRDITCGDGLCTRPEEHLYNCAADCAPRCGDGTCERPESPDTCAVDCPTSPPP